MGGKKASGKNYTSKGQRPNVKPEISKAIRRERPFSDRINAQLDAWSVGRRTMITVPNPNPNETNKRFIKMEGNQVFGPWKRVEK